MKKVVVVGATSAIAEHYARRMAVPGVWLILAGRSLGRTSAVAADLRTRGAGRVDCIAFDVNCVDDRARFFDSIVDATPVDVILIAHGTLPDQNAAATSVEYAISEFTTNATSTIALMIMAANILEQQRKGTLAVISSVAGDRGRASNALYGSAKAAVTTFASGLRQRLTGSDVNVLVVKPGLIDTPMTARFKKGPLWSTPENVATAICTAIRRGRSVVYAPAFWRFLMLIIRAVPERVFKRMRF